MAFLWEKRSESFKNRPQRRCYRGHCNSYLKRCSLRNVKVMTSPTWKIPHTQDRCGTWGTLTKQRKSRKSGKTTTQRYIWYSKVPQIDAQRSEEDVDVKFHDEAQREGNLREENTIPPGEPHGTDQQAGRTRGSCWLSCTFALSASSTSFWWKYASTLYQTWTTCFAILTPF